MNPVGCTEQLQLTEVVALVPLPPPRQRIPNQAANAAAKSRGTIFQIVYRRLVSRLAHNATIGATAHRRSWIIPHRGVDYEERGPSVIAKQDDSAIIIIIMIRELRSLGYRVEPVGIPA